MRKRGPKPAEDLTISVLNDAIEQIHVALSNEGMTQSDLAKKMGVSKSYISSLLGRSTNIELQTLAHIFHCLGMKFCIVGYKSETFLSSVEFQ